MIVYTKYSNERSRAFSIRTQIEKENDVLRVMKYAVTDEAKGHIRHIADSCERLEKLYQKQDTRFVPNRCRIVKDGVVELEYLKDKTLEEEFDDYLYRDPDHLLAMIADYLKELGKLADTTFSMSENFRNIFGDGNPFNGTPAVSVANIDMVPANIMISGEKWNVIDYEWTFDFPVPMEFLKWRVLHYYVEANSKRLFLLNYEIFRKFEISDEHRTLFLDYEKHFQSYVNGEYVPRHELYASMTPGSLDRNQINQNEAQLLEDEKKLKEDQQLLDERMAIIEKRDKEDAEASVGFIYFDRGHDFHDDDRLVFHADKKGKVDLSIDLDPDVKRVRIDPCECPCLVHVTELSTDMGLQFLDEIESNGYVLTGGNGLFATKDPKIIMDKWKPGAKKLTVKLIVNHLSLDFAGGLSESLKDKDNRMNLTLQSRARLQEIMDVREDELRAYMTTKSLRALRKARRTMKKPDPFQQMYPALPNDPEHILCRVDSIDYRKDSYLIRGWCIDKEFPNIKISVVDSMMNPAPCKIFRTRRRDVLGQFSVVDDYNCGYTIHLKYCDVDKPLFIHAENPRGFLNLPLDLEYNPDKRVQRAWNETTKTYDNWFHMHRPDEETLQKERTDHFDQNFKFSIVIPLYKTPEKFLRELVDSYEAQTYANWELVLSDGSGENSPIDGILSELEAKDRRIKVVRNNRQLYISDNTNEAIKAATGDFICFCDHDDVITPDALYENAKALREHPDVEVLYSDEDKITDDERYIEPHFKPDFNPDLLCSQNYICHFFVAKRNIVEKAGLLEGAYDGSQDHDFILRCTEATKHIYHIPKILYHWRLSNESTALNPYSKMYAYESGRRAVEAHWQRIGVPATVEKEAFLGHFRTYYHWKEKPLVSIVIPNKDHVDDLKRCLNSIVGKSTYKNYEIVIIENNSTEPETFAYYEELKKQLGERIKVVVYKGAFNYSAINNFGVKAASGEYLWFLNNDTEMIAPNGMEELLYPCMRSDVGIVGARLYYGNDTIQHAGVVIGFGGVAGHRFVGLKRSDMGYMYRVWVAQDMLAVTAACMMVKRSVFEKLGGFYEGLAVAYNDVDFCLRAGKETGLLVMYNPYAEFYHYESRSRGLDVKDEKKFERLKKESAIFTERWSQLLKDGDPTYNPNFSRKASAGFCALKENDEYDK